MSAEQNNKRIFTSPGFDPAISGNEAWKAEVDEAGEVVYEPIPASRLRSFDGHDDIDGTEPRQPPLYQHLRDAVWRERDETEAATWHMSRAAYKAFLEASGSHHSRMMCGLHTPGAGEERAAIAHVILSHKEHPDLFPIETWGIPYS